MSDKVVQYGPLLAPELEALIAELQLKNIPYEVEKEKTPSPQSFRLTLAKKDLPRISTHLENLGFPTALPVSPAPEEPRETPLSRVLKARAARRKFHFRLLTWFLVVGLLCLLFMAYGLRVLSQPSGL